MDQQLYLVIVFFILYAPIFYLMFYSFNSGGTMFNFEGFTLDWYKELFGDTRLLIIVLNTIIIALIIGSYFDHYWCDRGVGNFLCEKKNNKKYVTIVK